MEYIKKVKLDIDREYINEINVMQKDSARAILFSLYANGSNYSLANKTVRAWGVKPDKTKIFVDLTVVNASNGTCKLRLTNNMLAVKGQLKLMLTIAEMEDVLSTIPLVINISETLKSDAAVESTNEFTALDTTLKSVQEWDTYFSETSGQIEEKYTHRLNDLEKGVNRLKWLSASNTLTNGSTPTDIVYQHLKYQGVDQTLIVMVNITSTTDSNPVMMDNSRVIAAIDNAKSKGVGTVMLKPHLGINWSDGTERYNLNPSDMGIMLNNWKAILLNYASICNSKNIPVLCIGCEQRTMTTQTYKNYWEEIVNSIKSEYPDLLLTYAADSVEGIQFNTSCIYTLSGLDYIGLNLYPQWYKREYSAELTYKDIMPSAYNSYAPTGEGFKMVDRINYIKDVYNKDVYITEIGVMPFDDGLVTLKSQYAYDETAPRNYNVPAICYESMFNTYAKNKNVVGMSIWHTKFPFCYFDVASSATGESLAEEVIKKYILGGDLVE